MRKPLLVLAAVAVLLGAAVYAWSRRGDRVPFDDLTAPTDDAPHAPDASAPPGMGGADLARGPDRPPAPRKPPERAPGLTVVRTGDLVVTLVAPAGGAVPTSLRVDADPVGFAVHARRLAVEQSDRSWRFAELAVGRWRVRAFVPGFEDVAKEVEVLEGAEAAVALALERGAMATWKVTLLSGEAPEAVRLALLDARGVPTEATFEAGASTLHARPEGLPMLPSSGRIIGLKPGTFRLRATSAEGESDEKAFTVAAGETASVEITLRK